MRVQDWLSGLGLSASGCTTSSRFGPYFSDKNQSTGNTRLDERISWVAAIDTWELKKIAKEEGVQGWALADVGEGGQVQAG